MAGQLAQTLIAELERESTATAEILSRVPKDRGDWRPHEKSMTLSQLAWHVATIPRNIARLVTASTFDLNNARPAATAEHDDYPHALQESLAAAKEAILAIDERDAFLSKFTLTRGDKVVVDIPTVGAIRTMMLNHSYHHRGQLTVYLRLLDVALPPIYGRSADESI